MKTLRHCLAGVLATLLLCIAGPVLAEAAGRAPQVDGFDVEEVAQLTDGTTLHFTLYGSAGAAATLRITGAERPLALQEVQAGMYEGSYTIEPGDRITRDSRVTAQLQLGQRVASAVLEEPLVLGDLPRGLQLPPTEVASLGSRCDECGVVQSINAVQLRADPGYLGAVAGGLVGAILGSQVGRGDGRTAAGILGAVGGAYAGREIERANRKRTRYDVVVRLDNGSMQTRAYDAAPPFRIGDRVRVAHSILLREPEADPR